MTVREFENKCAFLAQTPQTRWFDLRLKAFLSMIKNTNLSIRDLGSLFPIAKQANLIVNCIKVENKYYFLIINQNGQITECFNVGNYSALKKINSYLPRQGLPEKDFDCSFWQFA